MKNVLIVYATREGQTQKIANTIAKHLLDAEVRVTVYNANQSNIQFDINRFDTIICGGSMHAGGIESELVQFIAGNRAQIAEKRNAFFLVLLSAATKDPKLKNEWLTEARKKMQSQLQFEFQKTEMIAGALNYSKYPWPLKWIMRRIAKKAGEDTDMSKDYEYTDWGQVKSFALSFVK